MDLQILGWLKETGITWVRPSDVERQFGVSRTRASWALARLRRYGLVSLVAKGLYYSCFARPLPNTLLLHREIAPDSYISFQAALHLRGVIDQAPYVVTCARWNGPSLRVDNDFGEYWFERVPRRFAFGFEAVPGGFYDLAVPEKALLDSVWLALRRGYRPRTEELYLAGNLDPDRFLEYARRMGLLRAVRRLGLADPSRWPGLEPQVK